MSLPSMFKIKAPAKKTTREKKSDDIAHLDEDIVRAIFDASGLCIYADDGFNKMHKAQNLKGVHLLDFIMFESEDALDDRSSVACSSFSVKDGIQNVSYFDMSSGNKDKNITFPKSLSFQKIQGQDSSEYTLVFFSKNENAPAIQNASITDIAALLPKNVSTASQEDAYKSNDTLMRDDSLSENDVSIFMNMSHELMAIIEPSGSFRDINNTIKRNLGYAEDHVRAMNFIDLVHPDDRGHVHTIMRSFINEDDTASHMAFFETRIVARDGSTRWTEWKIQQAEGALYTVGRDMTDAKRHEDELIRHQTQLSEAQEIGRMGHWRWEIEQNKVSWSDELYRIFGVSPEQFCPSLDNVNELLRRRDVGRMMQAFQRAMIEKKNYEMEFSILRADNEERSLKLQGRCELNAQGDVSSLFGVIQDVTERTTYERDLKKAKESAERAYAAKSQFLANMSHELRTPLNAIIGFSEMMQRQLLGPIGTEKYLDYINGIRESGEHLLDLISDILDMSKIEAGKYELDVEELNVAKIVRLAAHMMEGKAEDVGVKLNIEIEDEDSQLQGDRRAILQVLLNLLSNAVKFTEEGGNISLSCTKRANTVEFCVSDTGIGIPADKINDITNPFEQAAAHDTRDHEGSGLGLAITKELIDLHNGTMRIESQVGEGTTVIFRLPYTVEQDNN